MTLTRTKHSAKSFFYDDSFEDYKSSFNVKLKNGRRAKLLSSKYLRVDLSMIWDIHLFGPIYEEVCFVMMKQSKNVKRVDWKDIKFEK